MVLVFSDVSEDYRVQQALAATTALLERTGELANVGGWELDVRTMKLSWSAETCRIHEVVPPFAPTLDLALNFYAPEARPVIQAAVQAAIEHGTPFDQELALITAKGRQIWVRAQCSPVMTDGKATRLLGAFHDVTERKVAEGQLALQEAKFHIIFDHAPVGIALTNSGGVIMVNAAHARITGVPVAESGVPGVFARASHPEDYAKELAATEIFLRGEVDHYSVEKRYLHPDGRVQWAELTSRFFTVPATPERMIVTILTDHTARKATEDMLQRSEARYRSILNACPDNITITDLNGHILMASPAALKMFGYEREEQGLGRLLTDYIVPEDRDRAASNLSLKFLGPTAGAHEYRGLRHDGSTLTIEVNSEFIRNAAGRPTGIVFVVRDVTARK